jgi:hypothetical protein
MKLSAWCTIVLAARLPAHIPPRFNLSPAYGVQRGKRKKFKAQIHNPHTPFPFSPAFNSFYIFRPRRLIINKIEVNSVFLCCTRQTYYVRRCAHKTVSQFVRPSVGGSRTYIASWLCLWEHRISATLLFLALAAGIFLALSSPLSVDVVISYREISTC